MSSDDGQNKQPNTDTESSTPAPTTVPITTTEAPAPTTSSTTFAATSLSTSTTFSTTSPQPTESVQPSTTDSDCSSLAGLAKAQCMNKLFSQGLYLGGSDGCTEGAIACDVNGGFAICNFNKWVSLGCSAGTTCYAYNSGDEVDVGCNYIDTKVKFEKRESESLLNIFKRHIHHLH
jgi:chitinase